MTVLVTGGTGKTPTAVARALQARHVPFVIASRKGTPSPAVKGLEKVNWVAFDYADSTTFDNPFQHSSTKGDKISAIFLLVAEIPDSVKLVNSFIDHAVSKYGVKRFVVLGTQTLEKGGDKRHAEKVWEHLDDIGVDYTVLGPTMFMALENFTAPGHESFEMLRREKKIYTAVGKGKIPYVAVDDVAAFAAERLASDKPLSKGKELVLGPELLTVDDVGAIFGKATGQSIPVIHQSGEDRSRSLLEHGFSEWYAQFLPRIEGIAAAGGLADGHDAAVSNFNKAVGREGKKLSEWAEQNKSAWL